MTKTRGLRAAAAIVIFALSVSAAAAAEITRLTEHPAEDRSPSWSPDGERLLFASDRDGNSEIYLVNRDGSELTRLTENSTADASPSWAPSGDRFVFESDRDGTNALWIQELESGKAKRLLSDPSPELVPDWSPDGRWIAFMSQRSGNADLYRVAVEGGTVERLTTNTYRDVWPRYSADGGLLVFFSRRATHGEADDLFVLDLATRDIAQITDHPGHHDFVPDLAPDGERIVAGMSDRAANVRTLAIHQPGEPEPIHFAQGNHRVFHPTWSPDGEWIAYAARRTDGERADIYLERAPR